MSSTRWLPIAVVALSLAASGCARPSALEQLGLQHPVWTQDGLYLVDQPGPGTLFLRQAGTLKDYRAIVLDEIRLEFRQGVPEFEASERKRATAMVRRNIVRILSSSGLQAVEEPGIGVLRVRLAITQIDYNPLRVGVAGMAVVAASGGAVMTLELRDSVDDRRLLVYAQARELPFGTYSGPNQVDAERVADAFYEYTEDLAHFLHRAERGELPRPKAQAKLLLKP